MKKNMSKKLILAIRIACIGSIVVGIGGMRNVLAYEQPLQPIGYQADGGSVPVSYSNSGVYIDADGTAHWRMPSASDIHYEDAAQAYGNVAIGNFSMAGSQADLDDFLGVYVEVYREDTGGYYTYDDGSNGKLYSRDYSSGASI